MELSDEQLLDYYSKKNWKNDEEVLKSYQSLESEFGKRTTELNQLKEQLNPPTDASVYELDKYNGLTEEEKMALKLELIEAKMSKQQADTIVGKYVENKQRAMQTRDERIKQGIESMKKEWGDKFEENVALAQRGAKEVFGDPNAPEVKAIMQQVGSDVGLKLFHRLASDSRMPIGSPTNTPMTRSMAEQKLNELKALPEFSNDVFRNGSEINKQYIALKQIMRGGR